MLNIVTGPVNSGKTSLMKRIYCGFEPGTADGIVSEKVFVGERFTGYRLARLCNGQAVLLAVKQAEYHNQFTAACRYGDFVFSQEGILFCEGIMEGLLVDPDIKVVFLDEAGPLELQGRCFDTIIRRLLTSDKVLYITVRECCVEDFVGRYKIDGYRLIRAQDIY